MKEYLDRARKNYSEAWKNDSEYFYENGYYKWMEEAIAQYNTILEIGCGVGYSTLCLLETGHRVIAVDYNVYCLMKTKDLLERKGYKVKLIQREQINFDEQIYDINYNSIMLEYNPDYVYLIEGDILNDDSLQQWLFGYTLIDAILGWLIGGHSAIGFRGYYRKLNIHNDADYRIEIEDNIYRLGNKLLAPGKVINYVSRIMYPSEADIQEQKESLQEDIDLEYKYTSSIYGFIEYKSLIPNGIKMHPNNSGNHVNKRRALLSALMIKDN